MESFVMEFTENKQVLILIIMEDTHGVMLGFADGTKALLS